MRGLQDQLREDLYMAAERLGALVPQLHPMTNDHVRDAIAASAERLTAVLLSDDDHQVAEVVIDLQVLLWPHSDPDAEWWDTPLGHVSLRSIGADNAPSWTYSVAAAKLGVKASTVGTLVSRGTLDRHPDGGVTIPSVLHYRDHRGPRRG